MSRKCFIGYFPVFIPGHRGYDCGFPAYLPTQLSIDPASKEARLPVGRRRIAVYVPALVGGGAERVAAVLASGLSKAGHDVTLIVDFEASENRGFVDATVATVTLGGGHVRSLVRLSRVLAEQRFDIAFAI